MRILLFRTSSCGAALFLAMQLFCAAMLFAQENTPSQPELRLAGVDAAGKEIPLTTVTVTSSRTVSIYALQRALAADCAPLRTMFSDSALIANFLYEARGTRLERFRRHEMVRILQERLRLNPALTLALQPSSEERTQKNAVILKECLLEGTSIDAGRVSISTTPHNRKNGQILLQGAPELFAPMMQIDTIFTASPSIVRFFCTSATAQSFIPQQWAITIKLVGENRQSKNIRAPITAAGNLRPVVDWKFKDAAYTFHEFSFTKPDTVRCALEIRYKDPSISNERSAPVSFAVQRINTLQDSIPPVPEMCELDFEDDGKNARLSAEGQATVRQMKQSARFVQGFSIVCTMKAKEEEVATAAFQAQCKARARTIAQQFGCPETKVSVQKQALETDSPAGWLLASRMVQCRFIMPF
ncbi:MAG: hypothetical protein EAZ92_07380 [Candidatus Kapaibacterium sp.]|nr:MAG: hypothetical protein EAZ92_07380 [Candidatus Kapabacteria bacterium]